MWERGNLMDNDIRCPCSSTFKHIGYVRNGPSITLTPTGTIFSYFSYLYSYFIHPFFSFLHFGQTLFSSTVPPRCRLEVDGGVSRGVLSTSPGPNLNPPTPNQWLLGGEMMGYVGCQQRFG
jgi:hypothetical protein